LEANIFDKWVNPLRRTMPEADTMEDYLEDKILPKVRPWSEDLREEKFYVKKSWLELRDDVNFHKTVLHFFNPENEYLRSEDGEITAARWRYMADSNKLLLFDEKYREGELYDLAYLDDDFFVLRKHGDQRKLGNRGYIFLIHEPLGRNAEWRDAIELLYDKAGRSIGFYILLLVALALLAGFFLLI
jgi:hypothetical protein